MRNTVHFLPLAQSDPVYPDEHLHEKLPATLIHVPPFVQLSRFNSHSLISVNTCQCQYTYMYMGSPVTKRESFKRFVLSAVFSANPHSAWSELSGWALSVYSTLFYTSKNVRGLVKRHTKLWLCCARAVMTSLCTCIRPSHVCFIHRNYCAPVFNIFSNLYDLLSYSLLEVLFWFHDLKSRHWHMWNTWATYIFPQRV